MSAFEFVVLGASGTFPTPGGASTGFLLRSNRLNVWLDCGTGTFANLQKHLDYFDVDAVVVSHLHLDHVLDLYPFYYGLRYAITSDGPTHIPVYGPRGTEEFLSRLLEQRERGAFDEYLVFTEIGAGETLDLLPMKFTFERSHHPIETLAMRIEADGRSLGYTSDTGPTDQLDDLLKGVDVLIAEASTHTPREGLEDVHMTSEQTGRLAAAVGAGKLVLTHISPGLDPERSLSDAAKHFDGDIVVGRDDQVIAV